MENITLNHNIKPTFNLLKLTFGIGPIVAGLDKFTNILTNWEQYINPLLLKALPLSPHVFMLVVGIIEIAAGILVLKRPAIGGLVVSAWLTLIAVNLLLGGVFFDVAVRDLVMAIGAYSLARIAKLFS